MLHLLISREVGFLPRSCIRNVTETLPTLIQFTGYYPLLLFHLGNSDTDRNSLRRVRKDYRALGELTRDFEAQVVFLSSWSNERDLKGPLGSGKSTNGMGLVPLSRVQLLRQWSSLLTPGLLEADGIHLSEKGRDIFVHKLAKLVKRHLN